MTNHALSTDAIGPGGTSGRLRGDRRRQRRSRTRGPRRRPIGATVRCLLCQRNRLMTNHALATEATGSGGGTATSKVIADSNGDPKRLAYSGELFAHLSDVRSLRGIA